MALTIIIRRPPASGASSMKCVHASSMLLASLVLIASSSVQAQAPTPDQQDNVELIMSPRERSESRVRDFFTAVRQRIQSVTGQVLPFTKCEKWSVPRSNLEAVKKEAA